MLLDRWLGSRPRLAKLARYGTASAAGVVSSQIVLLTCVMALEMAAVPANLLAVTAGAVPNYLINRAWTFNKSGKNSLTREVLPFWGMGILGLLLSTVTVAWADRSFDGAPLALSAASVGAFGVLWVAKYFILDRILFAPVVVDHETPVR